MNSISERLSKEMPGLRGFSAANMKNMRIFFENWSDISNRQPLADGICQSVVEMTIRRHNTPLGVATYRSSADVPKEYESLKPLLEGAQRLLNEAEPEGVSE